MGSTGGLPVAEVSAGLQKGKVAFTWGQVRNWLSPAPTTPIHLPQETVLTLPSSWGVCPTFYTAFCHDCEYMSLTC